MNVAGILDCLKRYPLAVGCGLVLVVCGILIVLRGNTVTELLGREAELTARLHTIEENAKNSKELAADLKKLEEQVAMINGRLFDREARAINTNFFYSLEDEAEVVVSVVSQLVTEDPALSSGGPNELKLHSAVAYDIDVQGSFSGILKFLYELHQVDAFIRVSDFQINGSQGRGARADGLAAKLRVLVLAKKN
jgi:hypothetical protein